MGKRNPAIEEKVGEMVRELHISHYHRFLLTEMICSKLLNPLKKVDQIMNDVTSESSLKLYQLRRGKTREFVRISAAKELERLEEALHDCDNLPGKNNGEELRRGWIISNTIKYYTKKIMDE